MRRTSWLTTIAFVGFICGSIGNFIGWLPEYERAAPERIVTALPGVGPGWLDTLSRVAGNATIDTINDVELYKDSTFYNGRDLVGLYEWEHDIISLHANLPQYARFQRDIAVSGCMAQMRGQYIHPGDLLSPAAILAHEFGHMLQYRASPPGHVRPAWAIDWNDEHFADRFARAMLSIRGWVDPDTTDKVMNHRVRFLLRRSYWTEP